MSLHHGNVKRQGIFSADRKNGRPAIARPPRGPGIAGDVLLQSVDGVCPRDRGFLQRVEGEEFVIHRCVNCGWRDYSMVGKLTAKIALARAKEETAAALVRGNWSEEKRAMNKSE